MDSIFGGGKSKPKAKPNANAKGKPGGGNAPGHAQAQAKGKPQTKKAAAKEAKREKQKAKLQTLSHILPPASSAKRNKKFKKSADAAAAGGAAAAPGAAITAQISGEKLERVLKKRRQKELAAARDANQSAAQNQLRPLLPLIASAADDEDADADADAAAAIPSDGDDDDNAGTGASATASGSGVGSGDTAALIARIEQTVHNPYYDDYRRVVSAFPKAMPKLFAAGLTDAQRAPLFAALDDAAALAERYAWAVPDARALAVIATVAEGRGVVEMAAGKGYWGYCLKQANVSYVGYDLNAPKRAGPPPNTAAQAGGKRKPGAAPASAAAPGGKRQKLSAGKAAASAANDDDGDTAAADGEGEGGDELPRWADVRFGTPQVLAPPKRKRNRNKNKNKPKTAAAADDDSDTESGTGADADADGDAEDGGDAKQSSSAAPQRFNNSERVLLLVYPDGAASMDDSAGGEGEGEGEDGKDDAEAEESVALECLTHYRGDTVVHVGELFGATVEDNPWGKTSGALFQQSLAEQFHCVLALPLPSWPASRDTLTVWKRTRVTDFEGMRFKDIAPAERIDLARAAPAFKQWL